MSRTLQEFIADRWCELLNEEGPLLARLDEINTEKIRLKRAASAADIESQDFSKSPLFTEKKSPQRLSNKSIKEAVLEILKDAPSGLSAHDILETLNAKYGVSFGRASLSPQLSRLKHQGLLIVIDSIWSLNLVQKQSSNVSSAVSQIATTSNPFKDGDA